VGLVQDTLLRAYRHFDRFERGTKARACSTDREEHLHHECHYRQRRPRRLLLGDRGAAEACVEGAEFLLSRENPESEYLRERVEEKGGLAFAGLPGATARSSPEPGGASPTRRRPTSSSIPVGTVMSRLTAASSCRESCFPRREQGLAREKPSPGGGPSPPRAPPPREHGIPPGARFSPRNGAKATPRVLDAGKTSRRERGLRRSQGRRWGSWSPRGGIRRDVPSRSRCGEMSRQGPGVHPPSPPRFP